MEAKDRQKAIALLAPVLHLLTVRTSAIGDFGKLRAILLIKETLQTLDN